MLKQDIGYHTDKAQLILDNTRSLYDRQQAIFKVYLLTGDYDKFTGQLIDLAKHVVMQTNLSESSDEFMHGEMFDKVQANIYAILIDEYHGEFVKWHEVQDNKVVSL